MLAALRNDVRQRWRRARLRHELSIRQSAVFDARRNPPIPTQDELAPVETKIIKSYNDRRATLQNERQLALQTERINSIEHELGSHPLVFDAIVTKTKDLCQVADVEFKTAWVLARQRVEDRLRDLTDFKRDNMLEREAFYHSPILAIGVCAIAFVAETAANAAFFADVSRYGLAGGALNAMTLSVPNIILGLAAGFWGLRARHHVSPLIRSIGNVVVVLSLTAAVFWNFFVAHLRLVAERVGAANQELLISDWDSVTAQIRETPAAPFTSSQAVVLMLIGLLVVAIALWDGLDGFADRYPGFSQVDRRYRKAVREMDRVKRGFFATLKGIVRRGCVRLSQGSQAIQGMAREALQIVERAHAIIIAFAGRIADELTIHRDVLYDYQVVNRRNRQPITVPVRFNRLQFPADPDDLPDYDWDKARAQIKAVANAAEKAAKQASEHLDAYRLQLMAAVEAESLALTPSPALLPPQAMPAAEAV